MTQIVFSSRKQWSLGIPIDGIYDVDVCSVMYWRGLGGRAYLLPCR